VGYFTHLCIELIGMRFEELFRRKKQKPIILGSMPRRTTAPWYVGLIYLAACVPSLAAPYLIAVAGVAPAVGGALGVVIFVSVCAANWYPPFRKRVHYWLTLQENEALAYAWAEPTLYSLNGLFIVVSGLLIFLWTFSLE